MRMVGGEMFTKPELTDAHSEVHSFEEEDTQIMDRMGSTPGNEPDTAWDNSEGK